MFPAIRLWEDVGLDGRILGRAFKRVRPLGDFFLPVMMAELAQL